MKWRAGFTLVELMVVISLAALLLTWGIPAFSSWKQKHDVEGEMVQLYSDLQFARMNAYGNKALSGIYWGGGTTINQYRIMTNTNANATTIDSGATQIGAAVGTGKYPITSNANASQKSVSFDDRGFLYTGDPNDTAAQLAFYVTPDHGSATDCVSVSLTRIALGKWDGTNCNPK